jgi:hypothetical protein
MPAKSRKSTGPRTPSAKRRAAAARTRIAIIEELITLPPHLLARANLCADHAAQLCAHDPSLAAEARRFALLRAQMSWIHTRTDSLLTPIRYSPNPYEIPRPDTNYLLLHYRARRLLRSRFNASLRILLPFIRSLPKQAPAPLPAATRAASA